MKKYFEILILCLLIIFYTDSSSGNIYDMFEDLSPDKSKVESAIKAAKEISQKKRLTAPDIRKIYDAENYIGKYVWGISVDVQDTVIEDVITRNWQGRDARLSIECIKYIRANKTRLVEVPDGWKGENNFWEPNSFWLDTIIKMYPDSTERREIDFDLDFKAFTRQFDYDVDAKGKSCEVYYSELLKEHGDVYREVYSEDEIKGMVPNCKQTREKFILGRKKLLEKYGKTPLIKKLRDIDPTIVIVVYSVC